jgi:anti-sigma factor RsiW
MGHNISEREWLEYLGGRLPRARAARIGRHVETCAECAQLLGELTGWSRLLAKEGSRLRSALSVPEDEMDRLIERTVEEIRLTDSQYQRRGRGRTTAQGLFLLRLLIEPFVGSGTARIAIDLAVRRCTVDPGSELCGGDWPLFVNNLSETLASICGSAAARLVARAGAALLAEAA